MRTLLFLTIWFLFWLAIAGIGLLINWKTATYADMLNNCVVGWLALLIGWIPSALICIETDNTPDWMK